MPSLNDVYNMDSLCEWFTENVPYGLILCGDITAEKFIERLEELAQQEWSNGIDAMGEDA